MQETDILRNALSIIEGLLDSHDLKEAELRAAKCDSREGRQLADLRDRLERIKLYAQKELGSVHSQAIIGIAG